MKWMAKNCNVNYQIFCITVLHIKVFSMSDTTSHMHIERPPLAYGIGDLSQ